MNFHLGPNCIVYPLDYASIKGGLQRGLQILINLGQQDVKLQQGIVLGHYQKAPSEVIFSRDSADLGKTPLLKMDKPTGDNPPVTQRPYTLALKHVQWVQEEIEVLEKAGVIAKSVSPWASPIVIVPQKTAPGEPARRRMCVDYRM